jgi:polyisoprenoid-binding protein YceI
MKLRHAILSVTLLATSALAQQRLVPERSDISFTSKQIGVPVDGKFKTFDAQVSFAPNRPEAARIALTIDLASVALGAADAEAELARPDWFSTKLFPQATFQSSSVKALGGGKFDVAGKLSIKGSSREVVVPLTLSQSDGTTVATGTFVIKRLDFRIGDGEWKDISMVANDVQVRFRLSLTGIPPL